MNLISDWREVIGLAAAIVSFLAGAIYIFDILRFKAIPHRATWWILGLLNCAIAASYFKSGATSTIWLPLEYGLSFLICGALSLKYGEGRWRNADSLCMLGALTGLLIWWRTDSAPLALAIFTTIDLLGLLPTIAKAYHRPQTEASSAWGWGTLAALLNVFAIDRWTAEISAYPMYVLISSGLLFYLVRFRHRSSGSKVLSQ